MTNLLVTSPAEAGTLDEATDYLYRLPRGSKSVGLARAEALFRRLGSPQDVVRTVHVAGTAGKGSVSAFVASILTAHGFQVGAHVSPHVRTILERFQICGAPVSPTEFIDAVRDLAPAVDSVAATPLGTPTFFEATNAVAFSRFAARRLDYAVIETGIGGLLDATNTISRADKLAVITRIGIDHTRLLGDTAAEIAAHKAGILPVGGHAIVLRHHQASVRTTITQAAQRKHCRVDIIDPRDISCSVCPAGTVLHVGGTAYPLGLQGRHQGVNAVLALRAAQHLADRDGWRLTPEAIRTGLAQARLPGRFERHVVAGRDVILDGAHNNVKLVALVDTVRACYPGRRATWVLAAKADKDLQSVLAAIAPIAGSVVGTQLPEDSAGPAAPCIPATAVAEQARARGLRAVAVADPSAAVEMALNLDAGPVVVTGSFLHLAAADGALTAVTAR
ncbi:MULTISPECIES: bifunctional folylpolyglutamate synthase/dihydrofolate synthase [Mycolicibacterium]|uniref:tetrahydrofolate synthase n=1 Tax=Mycolicibacterium mageritense TaxID=53462 RepID=A0AAI8TXP1_MYCME|nr:Mur ligase family protein [Mycolicibacterium mageritense]TXI64696.1 MAG: hypothetical protein E6Q55_05275 [Mycolicibacterium mageritense]BDY30683.1 Dihydrofolate synthase/folylpolyglutamate synthase [Mycolicibacterium mageritense]